MTAVAILSSLGAPEWLNLLAEYGLGVVFGWTIFQSLFMRDMAGGSYTRSLRMTLLPEFVSMNGVMAGMVALSVPWRQSLGALGTPGHPEFWFVMSISLTLGFAVTFPLNWWLVSAGLKHGMITVQSVKNDATEAPMRAKARPMTKAGMVVLSLAMLAAGVTIAGTLGSLTTR